MRDWRDEERDRRIDEIHAHETGGTGGNDIIEFFTYIVIGFVIILVIAGLLDNWLGWGLVDFIWNAIYNWTDGAIGQPSN